MSKQSTVNTPRLNSVTGLDGEIQLVSYRSGVLIDVQGSHRRVTAPDVSDDVRQTRLRSETPIKMVSPKVYRRRQAAA